MRIGPVRFSAVSLLVLAVQLGLVASIAGKYLYQRWRCPRVWTRTAAYDPELVMRGRYLSLQLEVDGCGSTLPSGRQAVFPRNPDGTVSSPLYSIRGLDAVGFPARLTVENNRLKVVRLPDSADPRQGQTVMASPGSGCDAMRLLQPVNFYIGEHAESPLPVHAGDELWIEVTVPPKGPPRPLQLALKQQGAWKPLPLE